MLLCVLQDERKLVGTFTPFLAAVMTAVMGCNGGQLKTEVAPQAKYSAEKVYQEWGCGTCHGENGAGSSQGPSLVGLAAHWPRDLLIRYLKDPAAVRAIDARLEQLARHYDPISMPAFDGLDSTAIGMLADYLLHRQ